jgi:hypothetical protein
MAESENDLRFAGRERFHAVDLVGRAVRLAVAITSNRAILGVRDANVYGSVTGILLRAVKALCALKALAAGHPTARLTFAKHQGVERRALERLNGDGRAATLFQVGQHNADFQRLGLQFAG